MRVGLTGGIGAGKSVVAARLARLGAVVVDSDLLARDAVEPGSAGLVAVRAEFGAEVCTPDGSLDRARLAERVFGDSAARERLNAIVHPIVRRLAARADARAGADAVVVHDIPLLAESGRAGEYDLVVVVQAPLEQRLARLTSTRTMTEAQARERMAAQADDARRRTVADVVLVNDSTRDALERQVDALWARIR